MLASDIVNSLLLFLANPFILLTVKILAVTAKIFFFMILIKMRSKLTGSKRIWFFITSLLVLNLFIEFVWVIKILRKTLLTSITYPIILNLIRAAWACSILEYLSLIFFIDHITHSAQTLFYKGRHVIYASIGLCLFIAQVAIIYFYFTTTHNERPLIEFTLYKTTYFFILFSLIPVCYQSIKAAYSGTLPKILAFQLKTFIAFLIIPHAILELSAFNPFAFSAVYQHTIYPFICISTILFTYALYFCSRRIMRLRFLNISKKVELTSGSNFVQYFSDILEQLAFVTNTGQLRHIVQQFFKNIIGVPPGMAHFYARDIQEKNAYNDTNITPVLISTETLLTQFADSQEIKAYLYEKKILIKDELEFTYYYEKQEIIQSLISFMKAINADIFVPIYDKKTIVGYIIVEHNARPSRLFSSNDGDEIIIFASYLGAIINLLSHNNVPLFIKEQKELKEELHQKHQEINQYKESMRSFLRTTQERKIGIVFYKNRKFIIGNQAAQELVQIDLNVQQGHELTNVFKKVAKNAQEYKSVQLISTKDVAGNKLIVSGLPSLEGNTVIITLYYPEIADTFYKNRDLLKDPSEWDYALYLETTDSGQLINQLIPGSGEILLNFKISLLKAALSKKAILIDMPHEDIEATVDIIHHISLRTELHTVRVTTQEKNHEIAIKLFGINPFFGTPEEALLEKLNNVGTLFIENIELLHIETQIQLAEFLSYGYFRPLRSDRKIVSNVRIIVSSSQNLLQLVQNGLFSQDLLNAITKTAVHLPPLGLLNADELNELIDGYVEQTIKATELKNILGLTDKERANLINSNPLSLQEFREHVRNYLLKKTTKKKVNDITFDAAYLIADPELQNAMRRGKHALKDPQIMTMLWNKFKNQTKIAELLGVNRSSVNRRCKEYNLQ